MEILAERELLGYNRVATIVLDITAENILSVQIAEKETGRIEWLKECGKDGILAVEVYNHPFVFGYNFEPVEALA